MPIQNRVRENRAVTLTTFQYVFFTPMEDYEDIMILSISTQQLRMSRPKRTITRPTYLKALHLLLPTNRVHHNSTSPSNPSLVVVGTTRSLI